MMLKVHTLLLIFGFLLKAVFTASNSNTSVITIPAMRSRISSSGISNQINHVFTRYQEAILFEAASVSASFIKIPGLSLAVHHDQSMFYRISFQGGCQSGTLAYNFVHFLIDGRVLIENELLPNNDRRQTVAQHLGNNINEIDRRSGGVYMGYNVPLVASCPRFQTVVLPRGTHTIDVGIRINTPTMNLIGGQLNVELSTYDSNEQLGLSYPVIR